MPGTHVLFAGLAARLDRVTPEITARIRAEISGYSALAYNEHSPRMSTARSATPSAAW